MLVRAASKRPLRAWPVLAAMAAALLAAPPTARAEGEPVKIGAQADRGSGRLTLEWRRPVRYTVKRANAYVFIRFSRPFAGELAAPQRALSRYLAELRVACGGRVLVLRVTGRPRFAHYRRGNAVILTWIGVGHAAPARPENPNDSSGVPDRTPPKVAKDVAPPPRPAPPPHTPAEPPPLARAAPPPAAPVAPRTEEAKPPPAAKAPDPEPVKPEVRPAPEARPAPETEPKPAETPAALAISPTLTVTSNGAETGIVLAWPEPVAAAVFRYGDNVWMVFPGREAFDPEPFQRLLGPGVERLTRIEHAQATVLVARARADVRARIVHGRNVWTVVLKRETGTAPAPEVKLSISRGDNEQVSVPLLGAEAPIRIVDPEIGSILHVVPSRAVSGIAGERSFVTFRVVPALQGGVVEALADGLVVAAEGAAVTIRRNGGLLLSGDAPAGSAPHGR